MRLRRIVVLFVLVCAALAGMAAGVFWVRRATGEAVLRKALALDADDQAWLDGLPKPDAAWRDRARAWMRTRWPSFHAGRSREDQQALRDDLWRLRGESMPAIRRALHEAERAHVAQLTALLATDAACLTGASWIRDAVIGEQGPGSIHIPNLLSVRGAMRWYACEAMSAPDPTPALDRMDALYQALQPAGTIMDAMILAASAAMRDDAYVRLILTDALPTERVDAWLAESSPIRTGLADAYRGERIGFLHLFAQRILRDANAASCVGDAVSPIDFHWHGHRDAASALRVHRLYEQYVDGTVSADALEPIDRWVEEGGRTLHVLLPAFEATLWNVLHVRTQHRMYRLLVRVARSADRAPVSEAELRSALGTHASDLDGDAWTLAIQYERLNEKRLRFVVREDSPLTPHLRKQVARHLMNPGARSKSWDARPLHITARAVELQLAR